jgi:hypothetical protein
MSRYHPYDIASKDSDLELFRLDIGGFEIPEPRLLGCFLTMASTTKREPFHIQQHRILPKHPLRQRDMRDMPFGR